jgi:hypothetical protein
MVTDLSLSSPLKVNSDSALLPEGCQLMSGEDIGYLRALGKEGSDDLGLIIIKF